MSEVDDPTRCNNPSQLHEIRVQGHLDSRWTDWVGGMSFTYDPGGTTTLMGPLPDQEALHGVLARMRDLGIPIVSVRHV